MARRRASMREGPLAELFRATEAAQKQAGKAEPEATPPAEAIEPQEETVEHVPEFALAQEEAAVAAVPEPEPVFEPEPDPERAPEPVRLEPVPEPPPMLQPLPEQAPRLHRVPRGETAEMYWRGSASGGKERYVDALLVAPASALVSTFVAPSDEDLYDRWAGKQVTYVVVYHQDFLIH